MSGRAWMVGRATAAVIAVALLVAAVAMAARGLTVVTSPNPPAGNAIGALVAPSPGEIWAVGESTSASYSGCHGRPLARRWNGSGFAEVKSTTAICASDIWAVGSINHGRDVHIRHYDGTSWSTVTGATIPSPPPGRRLRTTGLFGASALSASDVWVVGKAEFDDFSRHTVTEHLDGSSWTLVLQWNGPHWRRVASQNVGSGDNWLSSVVAPRGVTDVWASGTSAAGTLIEHL